MAQNPLDYAKMVENALRGVVREALLCAIRDGLSGDSHFYISFRTEAAGVSIPDYLVKKYPDEMTIVLQHQFYDLKVEDHGFGVTLTFQNRPERLTIPFAAVTGFSDPSVKFGLQFEVPPAAAEPPVLRAVPTAGNPPEKLHAVPKLPAAVVPVGNPTDEPAPAGPRGGGAEVVTLDTFRKK